jgi:signal transduction histidine kinase/ligand-binding sensor domain-containing protein
MSQYVRTRWGPEQGFPRGSVYAIAQTSDGYLWIGSEAGLIRFDGLHFTAMRDDSGTFAFGSVLGLAADIDGSLWLRLRDMSLLRYRNGKFENPPSKNEPLSDITANARRNGGGLLAARMQMGAFTYRNGGLELVARAQGVPRSPVIALAQTNNGDVWMGTRGSGLYKLSGRDTIAVTRGLPDPKINCLLPEGDRNVWVGTDNGLAYWTGAELTTQGLPVALRSSQILSLAKDRDANLWVGTDGGNLLRFNSDGVASQGRPETEPANAITAVFEGREGSLWIGSDSGLERLQDSAFVTYSQPEGVPTDGSNPVFVDSDRVTWYAPVTGGLGWFRAERHGFIHGAGLDEDLVYSIAGSAKDLWLGRQRGGLTHLHSEQGHVQTKTYTKADGLAQNSVYSVYLERSGAVWAGTLSGGVSRLKQGSFTTYTVSDGLASNTVASIAQGADGTVWFATPDGLSSLAQGQWRTFTRAEGLPSEDVTCLLEDQYGVLWAGTVAGLAYGGSGGFAAPRGLPESLRDEILGLAEDKYGSLWLATPQHVLRVNRDRLLQGGLTAADVHEYGLADGLRGVEGVKRHRSVVADSLGRIWFSLNRGISVVDPARLTGNSAPALPQIQSLSADGVPIPLNGTVRIPPRPQRVVFGLTGLSLSAPERVRFRYFLDDYDRGWSEPTAEPQASYTNIGPGNYRLRVMAANPGGVWSDREAVLVFRVDPSYWQTWWFRAGLLVLSGVAALVFYRLRLRQLTARLNVRFEERLAERSRIAQELHDTLLQGFLSASMQIHVATSRLPADSQVKPAFARSLELMNQVIEEGRNAVSGLRSSSSPSLDLEEAFSRIQDELAAEPRREPLDFRVISEGVCMPLNPGVRDEVYRIGREALLNAFRHSGAETIETELIYSNRFFRLLVRDDGCGIAPETLNDGREGHWGIVGMRERAERIGARLRLWSTPGRGTEIELSVPGQVAFLRRAKPVRGRSEKNARSIGKSL